MVELLLVNMTEVLKNQRFTKKEKMNAFYNIF